MKRKSEDLLSFIFRVCEFMDFGCFVYGKTAVAFYATVFLFFICLRTGRHLQNTRTIFLSYPRFEFIHLRGGNTLNHRALLRRSGRFGPVRPVLPDLNTVDY